MSREKLHNLPMPPQSEAWKRREAESLRLARKEDWQCKIFGAIIWVLLSLFTCKGA